MAGIDDYSPTPASNTALFPEGMAPSAVNDGMRQVQADIRSWYNDAEWVIYGDGEGAHAITFVSGTTFTINGADVTEEYHPGRRVKAVGPTTGTIYGTIESSSFVTDTTVEVAWDSGSLVNENLTIYLGILRARNPSIPSVYPASRTIRTAGDAGLNLIGGTAGVLHLEDEGAGADRKIYQIVSDGGSLIIRSRNDDGSAKETLLTIDADGSVRIAATVPLMLESTDSGAVEGPVLEMHRNSASPANLDDLGAVHFVGKDSAGNRHAYAAIEGVAATVTNGMESGHIRFQTSQNGSAPPAARATIGAGLFMTGATGGDPGGGRINAQGFQINGDDAHSIVDAQLGVPGWIEWSNGLILQWHRVTNPAPVSNHTLARSYSSVHLAAWANDGSQGSLQTNIWAYPFSLTQIQTGRATSSIHYFSIGI
jgi:hypothetical protein